MLEENAEENAAQLRKEWVRVRVTKKASQCLETFSSVRKHFPVSGNIFQCLETVSSLWKHFPATGFCTSDCPSERTQQTIALRLLFPLECRNVDSAVRQEGQSKIAQPVSGNIFQCPETFSSVWKPFPETGCHVASSVWKPFPGSGNCFQTLESLSSVWKSFPEAGNFLSLSALTPRVVWGLNNSYGIAERRFSTHPRASAAAGASCRFWFTSCSCPATCSFLVCCGSRRQLGAPRA
jgi:hypothetical protein